MTKIYKCFIASPSDTLEERGICDKVFNEINQSTGSELGFRIESIKRENFVTPSFGESAQSVINQQTSNEYQIFIGIMHTKFGTPTGNNESGTEEEFNIAYDRYKTKGNVEIMFYFNDQAPSKLSEINTEELIKISGFKNRLKELGGLYCEYEGGVDFEKKIRMHLNQFILRTINKNGQETNAKIDHTVRDVIANIFKTRLEESLCVFSMQPLIWVDPILSITNEISQNPEDNYKNRKSPDDLISNPKDTIIKAPPQFGLTSLAHYFINEAWKNQQLWIYIDSVKTKAHNIHNVVKSEVELLGLKVEDVKCIVLDSWNNYESTSFKKLKSLCDAYKSIPIIVMHTIDDSKFLTEPSNEVIQRTFDVFHLLALPRTQIRKVVSEYNKVKGIGEDDAVLSKLVLDLDSLNMHRTPFNCLTLLKVSEKHFDESPVNRTKMLEMVLSVLFNTDEIPTYKTKPDLKDCEFVLGQFCENLIKNDKYEFSRDSFLKELQSFCKEKLIDLDVDVVFDVLKMNNIIVKKDSNYIFRSTYWILYFAAKRMHINHDFACYIFENSRYTAFPEIIEFYTGIDRNRTDALDILKIDLTRAIDKVKTKVGLPFNINPLHNAEWKPNKEQIEKMQDEIGGNVINSRLPDAVKDQYADKNYNQMRPYDQSIQKIFHEYSLTLLMQKIKASSRALRNSDYVEPEMKRALLIEILNGWQQLSNVLFAIAPILASNGRASFGGTEFFLVGDFGNTIQEIVNRILQVLPANVVGYYRNDLFSSKIGPLLYDQFNNREIDELIRHQLALLIIYERPRNWKKEIEEYIVSIPKNSFYLYNVVNALRAKYKFDFVSPEVLKEIEYLFKMGLAKHEFGDKKPSLDKIVKIDNSNLPKREVE